jgi:hypothetical protein
MDCVILRPITEPGDSSSEGVSEELLIIYLIADNRDVPREGSVGSGSPPKFHLLCKISISVGVSLLTLQTFHIQKFLGSLPKLLDPN